MTKINSALAALISLSLAAQASAHGPVQAPRGAAPVRLSGLTNVMTPPQRAMIPVMEAYVNGRIDEARLRQAAAVLNGELAAEDVAALPEAGAASASAGEQRLRLGRLKDEFLPSIGAHLLPDGDRAELQRALTGVAARVKKAAAGAIDAVAEAAGAGEAGGAAVDVEAAAPKRVSTGLSKPAPMTREEAALSFRSAGDMKGAPQMMAAFVSGRVSEADLMAWFGELTGGGYSVSERQLRDRANEALKAPAAALTADEKLDRLAVLQKAVGALDAEDVMLNRAALLGAIQHARNVLSPAKTVASVPDVEAAWPPSDLELRGLPPAAASEPAPRVAVGPKDLPHDVRTVLTAYVNDAGVSDATMTEWLTLRGVSSREGADALDALTARVSARRGGAIARGEQWRRLDALRRLPKSLLGNVTSNPHERAVLAQALERAVAAASPGRAAPAKAPPAKKAARAPLTAAFKADDLANLGLQFPDRTAYRSLLVEAANRLRRVAGRKIGVNPDETAGPAYWTEKAMLAFAWRFRSASEAEAFRMTRLLEAIERDAASQSVVYSDSARDRLLGALGLGRRKLYPVLSSAQRAEVRRREVEALTRRVAELIPAKRGVKAALRENSRGNYAIVVENGKASFTVSIDLDGGPDGQPTVSFYTAGRVSEAAAAFRAERKAGGFIRDVFASSPRLDVFVP